MHNKRYILSAIEAEQKLHRMSLELAEKLSGNELPVLLIGVKSSGMAIAHKIGKLLGNYIANDIRILSVILDKQWPETVELSEPVVLDGVNIILIDDVTNSGRTLLYALKPLLDAHPKTIQTLVLVERMYKLFPIKPDYVGISVSTTQSENIMVEELGGEIQGAFVE